MTFSAEVLHCGRFFEGTLRAKSGSDSIFLRVDKINPSGNIIVVSEVDENGLREPFGTRIPQSVPLNLFRQGIYGPYQLVPYDVSCPNSLETLQDIRDSWHQDQ